MIFFKRCASSSNRRSFRSTVNTSMRCKRFRLVSDSFLRERRRSRLGIFTKSDAKLGEKRRLHLSRLGFGFERRNGKSPSLLSAEIFFIGPFRLVRHHENQFVHQYSGLLQFQCPRGAAECRRFVRSGLFLMRTNVFVFLLFSEQPSVDQSGLFEILDQRAKSTRS